VAIRLPRSAAVCSTVAGSLPRCVDTPRASRPRGPCRGHSTFALSTAVQASRSSYAGGAACPEPHRMSAPNTAPCVKRIYALQTVSEGQESRASGILLSALGPVLALALVDLDSARLLAGSADVREETSGGEGP
jgi:hypothetical protein